MKIKNFNVNDIIYTQIGPIQIISLEDTVSFMDINGPNEAQLYKVLYNNEIHYASDMGLQLCNPSIFDKCIAGIGYRGCIDFKLYSKEYDLWKNMIYRCYWQNNSIYEYFGGQGITVCDRWKCFEFFLYDLINITNYDKFIQSKSVYELDLSVKQKKLPLEKRMYMPGKVSLKLFYQTDVALAVDNSKSKGINTTNIINDNIIDDSSNHQPVFNPYSNGRYPMQAYNYYAQHPQQLSMPSIETYPSGYVRTPYGLYRLK